jgi:SAM-dependent methyltransferase
VHFLVEDATEEWLWDADHFDYIRLNNMAGALPSSRDLIKKALRVLKPGGWLEWHDIDITPRCDDGTLPPPNLDGGYSQYAFHDWIEMQIKSAEEVEPFREVLIADKLAGEMREEGFADVNDRITKVPINPWPKDRRLKTLGAWYEENWLVGLSAYTYKPFLALGWAKAEIEVFLVSVRKCISNRHFHAYHNFHAVIARKPFPGEKSR